MRQSHTASRFATSYSQSLKPLLPLALVSLFGVSSVALADCVNPGGTAGCKASISAAVAAADLGAEIQIWPGTYKEEVVITKAMSLVAANPNIKPVINATGHANGIFINGTSTAPKPGAGHVLISGLAIHNANFEGILVVSAIDITLVDNHVYDNNQALDPTPDPVTGMGTCPGLPPFETNEQADCGEGIHLIGVSDSLVARNESNKNSGGILITDETGPSTHLLVSGNNVHNNGYACGITMASHPPSPTVTNPPNGLAFGVLFNTIADNVSDKNGLLLPGAGAGVGIFAPGPGSIAHGNVVIHNTLRDNGLPGVTMHNHAAFPAPAPPVDFNNNAIIGNIISGNAGETGQTATAGTTGINLFSVGPVAGTVITQNTIRDEEVAVSYDIPAGELNIHLNNFEITGLGIDSRGTGQVNGRSNWWNCQGGPGQTGCSTAVGTNVTFAPWLTAPF